MESCRQSTMSSEQYEQTMSQEPSMVDGFPGGTPTSTLLHTMLNQLLSKLITGNNDLKQTIRVNNQQLHDKCNALVQWKANVDRSVVQLTQNCHNTVGKLRSMKEANSLLLAQNTRLELQLNRATSLPQTNLPRTPAENGEVNESPHRDEIQTGEQSNYLGIVTNLEHQLKEIMKERDSLKQDCVKLQQNNQTLQSTIQGDQTKLEKLHQIESDQQMLIARLRMQDGELNQYKRRHLESEKSIKELKHQTWQLIEEVQMYQKQDHELNNKLEAAEKEKAGLGTALTRVNDQLQQEKKERQMQLESKDKTISDLRKVLEEKCQAVDDMFVEYNKLRQKNEKISADHALCMDHRAEYDKVYAQLLCAEESLEKKDREMKELADQVRKESSKTAKLQENVDFFKAQSDVFRQDFLIEREDRSKLHTVNERLQASIYEKEHIIEQLKNQIEQYRFGAIRR
uniref:NF-kappa-B essential modulator NEMO CC2-LZ domain-containing protein n=1 Tax=Ciona savignyi TaxID=51511 RepID=H2ZF39_CIOSA